MTKTKMIFAASFLSMALLAGASQTGTANAAPLAGSATQIAKVVKADGVQKVGWRRRAVRRYVRRNFHPRRWCYNHPYRCGRFARGWRRGYGYGAGAGYAGGGLCHRHLFPVAGMAFHAGVRCNHRHFRAYRSWEWVR